PCAITDTSAIRAFGIAATGNRHVIGEGTTAGIIADSTADIRPVIFDGRRSTIRIAASITSRARSSVAGGNTLQLTDRKTRMPRLRHGVRGVSRSHNDVSR